MKGWKILAIIYVIYFAIIAAITWWDNIPRFVKTTLNWLSKSTHAIRRWWWRLTVEEVHFG